MIASPEIIEVQSHFSPETDESEVVPGFAPNPSPLARQEAEDESLYLLGRPTLRQYVRFVRSHAVNPPDDGVLTKQWQAANKLVRTLEKEEAGLADDPPLTKVEINSATEPLLTEFLKDPLIKNGYSTVPTEVAYVELDRLVVYQHHIDLTYAGLLEGQLGPAPTPEQIFRACLLHHHPRPPVKWSRMHRDTFVFMSPSNDLRFLGSMKLQASNIKDYPPPGQLTGVIGLAVGFGSNFLNAVYAENRLILNNGSHRAYALRKSGVTRAPCIVQHVSSREELDLVAASEVTDNPDYYFKNPRPSMLKDYFHPELHAVMPVHRRLRQITLKFEVDEAYVPAF